MRCAVIGSTGSLGSHICLELLNRGHAVVGISSSPEKLGKHGRYQPAPFDLHTGDIGQLANILSEVEVVINSYSPRPGPNVYKSFLEATRCIIKAVKSLTEDKEGPYLIMVGGTGSLELPDQPFKTVVDSRRWWLTLRNTVADSAAATAHMVERLGGSGPVAESFQSYRNARLAVQAGKGTKADLDQITVVEKAVLQGPDPIPDLPLAARAALIMFEGNVYCTWSFLSPPAGYRPGARTGKYQIWKDQIPMLSTESATPKQEDWEEVQRNLLGISVADLAVAVVDEVELPQKVGVHWSAVGDLVDDKPRASYVRI